MQKRFFFSIAALQLWRVRNASGALMAKAVYEPLDPEEQAKLERLCKAHPELEAEQARYASFAKNFRLKSDELPFDLSARINAALEMSSTEARRQRWATACVAVAAVTLLTVAFYAGEMYFRDYVATTSEMPIARAPMPSAPPVSPDTEVMRAMDRACSLVADSDMTGAVALLENAIASYPDTPFNDGALLLLADIEYNFLQRYEQAFAAYDRLRIEHPATFATTDECETRYDLLAEMRRENYAPLYALDSARNRTSDAFSMLETLVVSYPNTVLAEVLVEEMRSLVKSNRQDTPSSRTSELELVRARCTNPIAVAQVDLTLGNIYCNTLNDRECARMHYLRAAASDHIALAHQANEALTRIE